MIDKNKLLEQLRRLEQWNNSDVPDWVVNVINGMPSAERKGKWIFNPRDAIEAMFTKPKCSECGFESADGGNYCPWCGADMRGEEDA